MYCMYIQSLISTSPFILHREMSDDPTSHSWSLRLEPAHESSWHSGCRRWWPAPPAIQFQASYHPSSDDTRVAQCGYLYETPPSLEFRVSTDHGSELIINRPNRARWWMVLGCMGIYSRSHGCIMYYTRLYLQIYSHPDLNIRLR